MGKHRDRQFRDRIGNWNLNLERFYAKQQPDPDGSDCIIWTGVKNNIGYPFMGVRDCDTDLYKMVTGHRVALTIKLGRAIAPGMNANHSCHRRDCVNPDHLTEGTQQQKMADMVRDNRKGGRALGVSIGPYLHRQHRRQYVYSDQQIQWMRSAEIEDIMQQLNLTRKQAYARRYAFRKGYRWLPQPEYPAARKRGRQK